MKYKLMAELCCPTCKADLALVGAHEVRGEVESGGLTCGSCGTEYPIVGFVPRFVLPENYANNFGFQWNKFRRTQLDSHTGLPISRERFFASTGWLPQALVGKVLLDVGCGAGRFAEIALSTGARVVALDYSPAAEACWQNFGFHPGLDVVQGDIYHLPFRANTFDCIYCLGVLQHTPDVRRAFLSLPEVLRPGGRLAVDVYPKSVQNILWPKYWLRPVTKRMPEAELFNVVRVLVEYLLPMSLRVGHIPLAGRKLRYFLPIANHEPDFPLSSAQVKEWALLDTYDMLSPAHDHPQSARTLRRWFCEGGLKEIEVFRKGHLIGRGAKPV